MPTKNLSEFTEKSLVALAGVTATGPTGETGLITDAATPVSSLASILGFTLAGLVAQLPADMLAFFSTGSNANGTWFRIGESAGLQICLSPSIAATSDLNIAVGSLYRNDNMEWTFPQPFSVQPVVVGTNETVSNHFVNCRPAANPLTGAYLRAFTGQSQIGYSYLAMAAGMWSD